MLDVICTDLRPGHLSLRVGNSSRRSEEIVNISDCAFQSEYDDDDDGDDDDDDDDDDLFRLVMSTVLHSCISGYASF